MSDRRLRCPSCDGRMREVERRGVHVDVCGECRGVFLDRGELDKLMDAVEDYNMSQIAAVAQAQGGHYQAPDAPHQAQRAPGEPPPAPPPAPPGHHQPVHPQPGTPGHHQPVHPQQRSAMSEAARLAQEALAWQQRRKSGHGHPKKRRGGLLGDILDF